MAVSLTNSAAQRVRSYLATRGHGIGLRVGVRRTGCSGWAYVIDYADEVGNEDIVFAADELKVIVDKKSLELIDGTEIDFVKEGINEAFKFRNPNTKSECGCGESFGV
ncbi:MAG: iron-sulfur cluster assembly protein IscA [Gammaproteobacteria bacterium]|nr:iron-sulfur cluster assembly protein IscA [Gammaproteobacteria bacterium]